MSGIKCIIHQKSQNELHKAQQNKYELKSKYIEICI